MKPSTGPGFGYAQTGHGSAGERHPREGGYVAANQIDGNGRLTLGGALADVAIV